MIDEPITLHSQNIDTTICFVRFISRYIIRLETEVWAQSYFPCSYVEKMEMIICCFHILHHFKRCFPRKQEWLPLKLNLTFFHTCFLFLNREQKQEIHKPSMLTFWFFSLLSNYLQRFIHILCFKTYLKFRIVWFIDF